MRSRLLAEAAAIGHLRPTDPAFWDAGHRAYDQPQITSSSEIEHGHQAVVDRPELLRRDVADAISKTVHVYCSDLLHENASL